MKRSFANLSQEKFDLIVIGGGIIGAGIARDAALRGIHTLLVEKEDFGWGTTSRSSRLIHGGLRYLRNFQFNLVKQDLKEREILLKNAPHLVHRLKFIIPLPNSELFYRLTLPMGLYLYDLLAARLKIPHWKHISKQQTLELDPGLAGVAGLLGAYLYYDCQSEFVERLCLENILSSVESGARALNYAEATELILKEGNVQGIQVRDVITGDIYDANGRMVIIAGGHWDDIIWNKFKIQSKYRLHKTKGIHLLTKKISNNALVLFAKSDGRLFFVIPWEEYSLIGTTDTDYTGDPDNVYASAADVDYLVTETKRYFPKFTHEDVFYAMAGVRPLVATGNSVASDTSRSHKIVDHEQQNNIKGLITVLGGKITAYRAVAEEAVDLACRKLDVRSPSVTASTPLPGAQVITKERLEGLARETSLPVDTVLYLFSVYGSRISLLADYIRQDKRLAQPISSGYKDILAQIKYAVDEEAACTASDFLLRRTGIGIRPAQGLDVVETVVKEMGALSGWSTLEQQNQIDKYRKSIESGQYFRIKESKSQSLHNHQNVTSGSK